MATRRVAVSEAGHHLRLGVAGNAQTYLAPHHPISLEQQDARLQALPPQRLFGKILGRIVLGRVDEPASSVDAVTGTAIGPYRKSRFL